MGGRSRTGFALCVVVALLAPAGAAAESIVFVKGGDVHLVGEQGTARLTTGGGYENPSMADDGTIVAIRATNNDEGRNVRRVHRMDTSGRLLNPPTQALPVDNSYYVGPLSSQVSPDGRHFAHHFFNHSPLMMRPEMPRVAIAATDRDMTNSNDIFEAGYYLNPTWIGSDTIVLFGTPGYIPNVQLYTMSTDQITDWFDAPELGHLTDGEVSADGTRFAATSEAGTHLQLFAMTGPPPAAPQATCRFSATEGTFQRPRWSPDGRELVWEQPDGLHVAAVPAIDDCPNIREGLLVAGGSDPDFGPADLPRQSSAAPVIQRYPLAVAVKVVCAKPCSLRAKLVQRGRTVSKAAKRLTKAGTARVLLPKKGRKGRATVITTLDGKVQRKSVKL